MSVETGLKIIVCRGPSCGVMGGAELQAWCRQLAEAGLAIDYEISGCTGNCSEAPVVLWNGCYLTEMSPEKMTAQLVQEDIL